MSLRAHKVVITTDDDKDGFRFGKRVTVDGREMLLVEGPVTVTVSNDDVMQVNLTLFADVEFRIEEKPSKGSRRRLRDRLTLRRR